MRTGTCSRSSTSPPISATPDRGNPTSAADSLRRDLRLSHLRVQPGRLLAARRPRPLRAGTAEGAQARHRRGHQWCRGRASKRDRDPIPEHPPGHGAGRRRAAAGPPQRRLPRLAKARYQVGQATLLDVRQAEVIKGQRTSRCCARVQTENEAKLDLLRRMGVEPPVPIEVIALSDSFPVTSPEFSLDSLLLLADEQNPVLRSLRARRRRRGGTCGRRSPSSSPRCRCSAGWSGFTQQFTDNDLLLGQSLSDAQSQARGTALQQPDPLGAEPRRRGAQL